MHNSQTRSGWATHLRVGISHQVLSPKPVGSAVMSVFLLRPDFELVSFTPEACGETHAHVQDHEQLRQMRNLSSEMQQG